VPDEPAPIGSEGAEATAEVAVASGIAACILVSPEPGAGDDGVFVAKAGDSAMEELLPSSAGEAAAAAAASVVAVAASSATELLRQTGGREGAEEEEECREEEGSRRLQVFEEEDEEDEEEAGGSPPPPLARGHFGSGCSCGGTRLHDAAPSTPSRARHSSSIVADVMLIPSLSGKAESGGSSRSSALRAPLHFAGAAY
jgi:hypothetical protein